MFRELLEREFGPYGSLTAGQLDLLEAHYNLLRQWNTRLNLTRIDSPEEAVRLHYCESLFIGTKLRAGPLNIADVGSGAGFPGIPLAVLRPECMVTLVESHRRKAVFLREASRNLANVQVVTSRAENLKTEFDWVVSRAVSSSDVIKLSISNNFALLVGGEEAFGFESRQRIPWGTNRFLTFHVKQSC
jgi:16S rRNA (guanine(527)-N(7))-methyltransferase RsmG